MACEPHATRLPGMGRLKNGNRTGNPGNAPRCGAMTRSGASCRAAAMPNGRCRMHGGPSTGPRTDEGKSVSEHRARNTGALAKRQFSGGARLGQSFGTCAPCCGRWQHMSARAVFLPVESI